MTPNRVHLIASGNPLGPDAARLGFETADDYVAFAREHAPRSLRLTYNPRLLRATEDEWHGGRDDDSLRVRDLNAALRDPKTLGIVALSGGAYFSRIVPQVDFSPLTSRREPLWALGFSEMTSLVNLVASYRCGRGLYWLCPNWLGWAVRPRPAARAALAEFWRSLGQVLCGQTPTDAEHLAFGPIRGELAAGRVRSGRVRLVGGCLAVLAANVGGRVGRRIRPTGRWLMLEDLKEPPYRIDRHLAALKIAGWLEHAAGLVVGDFRMVNRDTQPAVLDLLRYHLPKGRGVPVVTTRSFGHVWPLVPVPLNRSTLMEVRGRQVAIQADRARSR